MESERLRQDRIDAWAQVRAAFQAAGELGREAKRLQAQQAEPGQGPPDEARAKGPPASYIRRRQELRNALVVNLKSFLGKYLGEHQASHCLVPLVIAIDERERVALGPLAKKWSLPRLQVELLQIDDGGDRFYDELDAHLGASGVHGLVFELYLLCLKGGFEGRYQGREAERQAFVERLVERIRREDPRRALASAPGASLARAEPALEPPPDGRRRKVSFVAFPYRYYLGVVGLAVALFFGLRVHSNTVVAQSAIGCACLPSGQQNPECQSGHDP
jgi:type IV/VI secretion system ImpK/VasF family protein